MEVELLFLIYDRKFQVKDTVFKSYMILIDVKKLQLKSL